MITDGESRSRITSDVSLTGNISLDALLYGSSWGLDSDRVVTYSFATAGSSWAGYDEGGEPHSGFFPSGEVVADAVRYALVQWSSVANLNFLETDESVGQLGTIRIGFTSLGMSAGVLGYTYAPRETPSGGDVWLNAQLKDDFYSSPTPGELSGFALLHELGHALGLKHPHSGSPSNGVTLDAKEDTLFSSVESYFIRPGVVLTKTSIDRLPSTPMALDIDALQYLYGANTASHAGDDTYAYESTGKYLQTIYDTGGSDSIYVTGDRAARVDLRSDAWSEIGTPVRINGGTIRNSDTVRIYKTTCIENAKGGDGPDTLIGNDADNLLVGNAGNDTIVGGVGSDTLDGGDGSERMAGGAGADTFIFSSLGGGSFDSILDFSEEDVLVFDTAIFTSLKDPDAGNLAFNRALAADDYLIYKSGSRSLYYDADGAGNSFHPVKIVALKGADSRTLTFDDMDFT